MPGLLKQRVTGLLGRLRSAISEGLRPKGALAGAVADLFRTHGELRAENALLRQQLMVASRRVKKPKLTTLDRLIVLFAAARSPAWRESLMLVKPETILRWHRQGFRLFWRVKALRGQRRPRLQAETVVLIKKMASENRLWGAERIRGELLKLSIAVSKRTVQKYMRGVRPTKPSGQSWETFIASHAEAIWSCDFVQTYDRWFRPIFAFFIINVGTREVISVGVTRSPCATWTAQQLKNATPFGEGPKFIIRDRDAKFGAEFDRAAEGVDARVIKTAVRTPDMNAHCERFLRSVRAECLDQVLIVDECHMRRVLVEYVEYFNRARPHQGLQQRIPCEKLGVAAGHTGDVIANPVLNGLHHDYRRAA